MFMWIIMHLYVRSTGAVYLKGARRLKAIFETLRLHRPSLSMLSILDKRRDKW